MISAGLSLSGSLLTSVEKFFVVVAKIASKLKDCVNIVVKKIVSCGTGDRKRVMCTIFQDHRYF